MEVFHDVDAARGTQINNAIIKLDGIRAQQTVDGALQKLWDNPRRHRRTSATSMARRLDQLEAIWRAHIDKHPGCMNGPASLSPSPTPTWRVKAANLSSLCFETLRHGFCSMKDDGATWLRLIVQLSVTNAAVRAGMVLFGAVVQSASASFSCNSAHSILRRRHAALLALQKELRTTKTTSAAQVFIASVLLAASEALCGDLAGGALHLRGAFLAIGRIRAAPATSSHQSSPAPVSSTMSSFSPASECENLHALALSMDIHTAWFRLSQPPDLDPTFCPGAVQLMGTCKTTDKMAILQLLHSCYHFAYRVSPFKYMSAAYAPAALVEEQCRYLAALRSALASLRSSDLMHTKRAGDIQKNLVLRAQCLSTFIYLSTILVPYEVAYDVYNTEFADIVQACELLTRHPVNEVSVRPAFQYSLEPGIFQPCYLTAMKCRSLPIRQRAITLLSQLGCEGPWKSPQSTAVARRALQLEQIVVDGFVPERARIHGCSTFTLQLSDGTASRSFRAEFAFCNDVDRMVADGDPDDPRYWTMISEDFDIVP
ncbi:uncharacterized protein AB675_24 [Cyphellophora attinorum]|uniref:Transcription factor domain-containing protein n=1 Tax=Cyphellophora attinorum TaxID=1664694 RepID=A0A0N1HGT4_9EURO|nr:uncharacterized protein AB675_24 [Phialophora attinorum]KPI34743.1 hypothetical protein AB675_24 [Phialophora attinorum]